MNTMNRPAKNSPDPSGKGFPTFLGPVTVSLTCHMMLLVLIAFWPAQQVKKPDISSVIRVSMVTLPEKAAPAPSKEPSVQTKPKPSPKTVVKKKTSPVVKTTKKAPPPVTKTKPTKKKKVSLKKKTFKSTKVVKSAIQQLEKRVEETKPDPIATALDRLKKKVGEEQFRESQKKAKEAPVSSGTGKGKISHAGDGKKIVQLIDIYRVEIAFQIQKNWAFSTQLAGKTDHLQASVVFKVMPDGQIKDLFFTDRSGNQYLDDSAYKAVMKSNPVDPHPKGINKAYVHVGLRFTPEGVR